MTEPFQRHRMALTVQDVKVEIDAITRGGSATPIVFLHGFGSTKEDYADITRIATLADRPFLAYDAPGCGASLCDDLSKLSIPFLEDTALAMLEAVGYDRFHLVGHSMGGLTALMLADAAPGRVASFIDIEGNIAPEDCFLSRQIFDYPDDDDAAFLDAFIARAHAAPAWSSPLYAASLRHKVRTGAPRGIFTSMVELSDNAGLMDRFLGLPCPKMFMYGDQNDGLSYLDQLRRNGVALARIDACGHFPMYANPPQMWRFITDFVARSERG